MSTPPTDAGRDSDRVAEIRQRLEAAEAGPWVFAPNIHGDPFVAVEGFPVTRRICTVTTAPDDYGKATAEFIAAAPDDLAWLLSRLAVVEAERDELRAKVADGRCGGRAPSLTPAVPCVLPSGHVGWHRADSGMEWTEGPS